MNRRKHHRYSHALNRSIQVVVSILILTFCLGPLYWALATSFKPMGTEYLLPPELWPSSPSLQAYRAVLGMPESLDKVRADKTGVWQHADRFAMPQALNFIVPLRNSLIVSSLVAIGSLVISSLSAYAIARLRFRYKVHSLLLLQAAGMLPPVMVISPTFVLLRNLGLLRTLTAMIIPNIAYNIPFSTWVLACYFAELPFELEDAAKVDGYRPPHILWRVVLPLSKPGLFSAGIFAFLGSWGEFMLANAVTMGVASVRTVPLAILNFSFEFRYQWTWISAAIILSVLVIVSITLVFQRWVIRGLTAGAVKY